MRLSGSCQISGLKMGATYRVLNGLPHELKFNPFYSEVILW